MNALGLDSLMALEIKNQLEADLKIAVPLATFMEGANLNEFVDLVLALIAASEEAQTPEPVAVQRISRAADLPLSFAQERLWFLDQLEPGNTAYNIPSAVRLSGTLDATALERAFSEIVRRHEVLRTTFRLKDGRPVQVIASDPTFSLRLVEISSLPEKDREAEAKRLAIEEVRRPFDLSRDLMLRGLVIRLAEREHVVVTTMHHIASDGWSMGVFVAEVAALYNAFIGNKPSPLPDLPFQCVDFDHWQRQWLRNEVSEAQLAYWTQQLSDSPAALELPADRPRPAAQTFSGAREHFQLPRSLSTRLSELSREEGCTIFMTLLAGFNVALYKYTQKDDISIGTFIANRNKPGTQSLIGLFVNNLVLRTKLAGEPTFRQVMARVRQTTLGAYQNQDLPFEQILDALKIERSLSRTPLFQIVFSFPNAPVPPLELPGLEGERVRVETARSNFDMTFTIVEQEDDLSGYVEYNTDLFNVGTIQRFVKSYQTLLEAAVANPEQKIAVLSPLTPDDEQQLQARSAAAGCEYAIENCIHHIIEEQVRDNPHSIAVAWQDGHLTYDVLNRRANQVAHFLQSLGAGPDSLVGICMDPSPEMIVSLLGVLKAGAAYVPFDPAYPRERLAGMLEESRVSFVLTKARLLANLPDDDKRFVCVDGDWHRISSESELNPTASVSLDHRMYAIFTSGSTGQPKMAAVRHRGFVNLMQWFVSEFQIGSDDRTLLVSSFSFDLTQKNFFAPLMTGGRLYLLPASAYDPNLIRGSIESCRHYFIELHAKRISPACRRRSCFVAGTAAVIALPVSGRRADFDSAVAELGRIASLQYANRQYLRPDGVHRHLRVLPAGESAVLSGFHRADWNSNSKRAAVCHGQEPGACAARRRRRVMHRRRWRRRGLHQRCRPDFAKILDGSVCGEWPAVPDRRSCSLAGRRRVGIYWPHRSTG
jgi:non-ribosomal peptide synthetase component F